MSKFAVRIERVEFATVVVEASFPLLARNAVMKQLDELAEGQGMKVDSGWQQDGYSVDGGQRASMRVTMRETILNVVLAIGIDMLVGLAAAVVLVAIGEALA